MKLFGFELRKIKNDIKKRPVSKYTSGGLFYYSPRMTTAQLLANSTVNACVNIIADAVSLLSRAVRAHMKPGGVFICSGIILEREQDVLDALAEAGFTVDRIEHRGEWSAIAAR